ncbi:aminopeptidase P family protein [Puniceibacterium sp. IMCC21224]|uniref:aminopeptidase P family protein n=1 Tax=Puniceibacterium sp. IMCC21224 TaxID=1618204 RepID=UPI00065D2600|nr:aminopeptidase P family protein [Puniceibacterium sp. IMCC21224]KMK67878.1 Xaa-Pro aminopeptidase [Puniceibacterium sp. IMCC21224]
MLRCKMEVRVFQSFDETASPSQGPGRLQALRDVLQSEALDGFIVPRADAYQGEYVAPCDDRLAWLTGFTGSAGFCVALAERAGVFVDSRYRVQVKAQVAADFTPLDWPEIGLAEWITESLPNGGRVGFDPWLHTLDGWRTLRNKLNAVELIRCSNLIDQIWTDQPEPPVGPVFAQPLELAGEPHGAKITRLAATLGRAQTAVITQPDAIAWLLNIRGSDIPRNPVPHGFALLHSDATVTLFIAPAKLTGLGDHLGSQVTVAAIDAFPAAIAALQGPVAVDPASVPVAIVDMLETARVAIIEAQDPCQLPKARKNEAEIAGTRTAHLRDGAAMVRFLAWLDRQPPGSLTEIDVVCALEGERRATNALRDISFETISGTGPHGAIVHYRVTKRSNARIEDGHLLLVDSGGQYVDGTTDITRTVAIGTVGDEERTNFTRVLRGMIAVSRARWPRGLAGRDLDALARVPLWEAGLDYGHGTGHGVGSYLCVHEGPQRLARTGVVPFEPGMILSNEPGFYREGAYGIRIENLIAVREAAAIEGGTVPGMLSFETLTYVPIDRRLIVADMLTGPETDWLNAYHMTCRDMLTPLVDGAARNWLMAATEPL